MRRLIHGGVVVVLISTVLAITAGPVGAQSQTCGGLQPTIVGTEGDDRLVGTDDDDVILALGGNDLVIGGEGDDTICLGAGDDRGLGQKGEDLIFGETGDDLITGGNRGDAIDGGPGNDIIRGNNGTDVLLGGQGNDLILGGRNNDIIEGNQGDDELRGGAALDDILGGAGDDIILAGRGRDTIDGEGGVDFLDGGLQDDIIISTDDNVDTIDDRDGNDGCTIDPFDLGVGCEFGDLGSLQGEGDSTVTFDPDVIATAFFDPGFPAGPHYLLQYGVISDELTQITATDAGGNLLLDLPIPAGVDVSAGNVIVQGLPAEVVISGADEWHLGVVQPSVVEAVAFEFVTTDRAAVFRVDNAPQGTESEITFTNPTDVDLFAIVVIAGDDGLVVNTPIDIPPGGTVIDGGTLFPNARFINVFAPGIQWEYNQLN